MLKFKPWGTDGEVSDGFWGGDPALDLGHLAGLLSQSHARKEVLHSSFNGFIRVSVYAIQVVDLVHL